MSAIPPFTPLTDEVLADMRRRMVESKGDHEAAGLTLQDLRNMIYTKCLRVNPNIEAQYAEEAEGAETKPKTRKPSKVVASVNGASKLDGLLG